MPRRGEGLSPPSYRKLCQRQRRTLSRPAPEDHSQLQAARMLRADGVDRKVCFTVRSCDRDLGERRLRSTQDAMRPPHSHGTVQTIIAKILCAKKVRGRRMGTADGSTGGWWCGLSPRRTGRSPFELPCSKWMVSHGRCICFVNVGTCCSPGVLPGTAAHGGFRRPRSPRPRRGNPSRPRWQACGPQHPARFFSILGPLFAVSAWSDSLGFC